MKTWLKAQLHIHIKGDPRDNFIQYSLKDLIDKAKKEKFDVLAITCHDKIIEYSKEELDYADKKGILLIKGVERNIEGKDILIYNPPKNVANITKINRLKALREKYNVLIGAPHPFYKFHSLGKIIIKHVKLFDFFEYSFFYSKIFNPFNKKTERLAKKHNKALIGTSDVHFLKDLNRTYSLIYAEKNMDSIFDAIKKGKVKVVSKPLKVLEFIVDSIHLFLR